MSTKLNTVLRARLLERYNTDFGGGELRVYTLTQPVDPNDVPTGVLLGTSTLPATPFTSAVDGVINKNGSWLGEIIATGAAGWFRMYSSDFLSWVDGDVTAVGGGGVIEMTDLNFVSGNVFVVDTVTITQPAE